MVEPVVSTIFSCRKRPDGFSTSRNPSVCMDKINNSLVGPKRFLTERIIR
ncbi:Uncharacterised protein [Chlamydia trachomatis]|nr:Uncharacterised protein [Chlamydia trachomatis]